MPRLYGRRDARRYNVCRSASAPLQTVRQRCCLVMFGFEFGGSMVSEYGRLATIIIAARQESGRY